MDSNVRNLIVRAQKTQGSYSLDYIYEAHVLMQKVLCSNKDSSSISFGLDLLILCAEIAYENRQVEIAADCLQMYFRSEYTNDQFYGRAYICQAVLNAPDPEHIDSLENCTSNVMKAIAFGLEKSRYHFIVYNATVIYWQLVRPFLKPGSRRFLITSLTRIVDALENIENDDKDWQAQLLIALVECHADDANRESDAAEKCAISALEFVQKNCPQRLNKLLAILIQHGLAEGTIQEFSESSKSLRIFCRINELRCKGTEANLDKAACEAEIFQILSDILTQEQNNESNNNSKKKNSKSSKESPLGEQTDDKSLSDRSLHPEQEKEYQVCEPSDEKFIEDRPMLLLELARLSSDIGLPQICAECIEHIKRLSKNCQLDESLLHQVQFLCCELSVAQSVTQESDLYLKSSVEKRLYAINEACAVLQNCQCLEDNDLTQVGCTTIWNLCLPLFQFNLRHLIRSHLNLIADYLESMDSQLRELRCQIHMELAKCEEDCEKIDCAISNLQKAMLLDDADVYTERLRISLHKLRLAADTGRQSDRAEDIARQIIEQANMADIGTLGMKRAMLIKAGLALAPDDFNVVLDSETLAFDVSGIHDVQEKVHYLAKKAIHYHMHFEKISEHFSHVNCCDDKERAQLWADLAKLARKQEVWDVCRVASSFCLLYDDDRWPTDAGGRYSGIDPLATVKDNSCKQGTETVLDDNVKQSDSARKNSPVVEKKLGSGKSVAASSMSAKSQAADDMKWVDPGPDPFDINSIDLYELDLLRCFAEIHFIRAEALIELLRAEGTELGCDPVVPVDQHKHAAGFNRVLASELSDWTVYKEWIDYLSSTTKKHFLRAAQIGRRLNESWIVCRSAAYLWNYSRRVLLEHRYSVLVEDYRQIYHDLKAVGHNGELELLVQICNVLAIGMIQPWIPQAEKPRPAEETPDDKKDKGKAVKVKAVEEKGLSEEALSSVQQALEVCEYGKKLIDGHNNGATVSLSIRQQLLRTWVTIKHWLLQPIGKSLGTKDEKNEEDMNILTRALVAVEIICNESIPPDCKETAVLPIAEIADLLESCKWADSLIAIQCFTRLATIAHKSTNHELVIRCATKVIDTPLESVTTGSTRDEQKQECANRRIVYKQLLSCAYSIYGQSLFQNSKGRISDVRQALKLLAQAACHGGSAGDYCLVLNASRHYWNISQALITRPLERRLMQSDLCIILNAMKQTTNSSGYPTYANDSYIWPLNSLHLQCAQSLEAKNLVTSVCGNDNKNNNTTTTSVAQPNVDDSSPNINDDLTLRAYLYGLLFQSYTDMCEWKKGLKAMEQAIKDMPRTKHRLLIYKHMVLTKARLGMSFTADIQKFMEEDAELKAELWHAVALSSTKQLVQLQAYQSAVESLKCPEADFFKCELLLELSECLYSHKRPLAEVQDIIEWAIDILLIMFSPQKLACKNTELLTEEEGKDDSGKKKDSKKEKSKREKKSGASKADKEKPGSAKKKGAKMKSNADKTSTKGEELGKEEESYEVGPRPCSSEIGVSALNPCISFSDLTSIRQMEMLFRCYSLLALVSGKDSDSFETYCLTAYHLVLRMIKVSIESSLEVQDIINELTEKGASKRSKEKDKSAKERPASGKSKEKSPKKGNITKSEAVSKKTIIPDSFEDWSVYNISLEHYKSFQHESMRSTTGLTKQTITKPSVSMWFLELLVDNLTHLGYHHLTLPVLVLEEFISKHLFDSRLLSSFIHLQAMDICTKLNLADGLEYHKRLTEFKINAEDQAKCRDQIESKKSERKVLATRKLADSSGTPNDEFDHVQGHQFLREYHAEDIMTIWMKICDKFLDMCHYEPVLDLLSELHKAALALDDKQLLGRVLLKMARLALAEAQYTQAIVLCNEAQNTCGGDEKFWFDIAVVLFKSILNNRDERESIRISEAKKILETAKSTFSELQCKQYRPQEAALQLARLKIELAQAQASPLLQWMKDNQQILQEDHLDQLMQARESFSEAARELERLGYDMEASHAMKQHAEIYWKLALLETCAEKKHEYFNQAESVLRYAENAAQKKYLHIRDAILLDYAVSEETMMVLPVQMKCVEMKLLYGRLLIDIFDTYVSESHQRTREYRAKSAIQRTLEEITCETPIVTGHEKSYVELTSCLADRILSILTSAAELKSNLSYHQAEILLLFGRSFRLLSSLTNPDPPTHWCEPSTPEPIPSSPIEEPGRSKSPGTPTKKGAKPKTPSGKEKTSAKGKNKKSETQDKPADGTLTEGGTREATEVSNKGGSFGSIDIDSSLHSEQYVHQLFDFRQKQTYYDMSTRYLMDGCENLSQALKLALDNGFQKIASEAALELVECFGKTEPNVSSKYLALHQSCQASQYLRNLMRKAFTDPTLSHTASLLHQYDSLVSAHGVSSFLNRPVMQSIESSLRASSMAWNQLSISANHLNLIKEFPSNFLFVVLQHSPDRRYLYCSIMDKPVQDSTPMRPSIANVSRTSTCARRIADLVKKCRSFQNDLQQTLLKQAYRNDNLSNREKLLGVDDLCGTSKTQNLSAGDASIGQCLLKRFNSILCEVEEYLKPISCHIENYLRSISAQSNTADVSALTEESVVLLADEYLLELPLEALNVLKHLKIGSISRDISLQLLYHRSHRDSALENSLRPIERLGGAGGNRSPSPKREGNSNQSAKNSKGEKSKKAPVSAVDSLIARATGIKYIVDPCLDFIKKDAEQPITEFTELLESYKTKGSALWRGMTGQEHILSPAEFEMYLAESSGFIFYGPERFLSYLPPHKLTALNLVDCQIGLFMDRMQTSVSYGRQVKLDLTKTEIMRNLESQVDSALLLSLAGVKCCYINQWFCTPTENKIKLELLFKELLEQGRTAGQALCYILDPTRRQRLETLQQIDNPAEDTSDKKASQKKGKKVEASSTKKSSVKKKPGDDKKNIEEEIIDETPEREKISRDDILLPPGSNHQSDSPSSFNLICYGLPNVLIGVQGK